MSGGVDSSVAAHLLLEAGHDVIGVFMRHGEASAEVCRADGEGSDQVPGTGVRPLLPVLGDAGAARADHKQGCCTATDAADARRVASKLGIPFYALDLQADFRRIVDYFVEDYVNGRTPNPCVRCNHWIKFGRLFDYADGVDADFVATGHYARMLEDGELHRGIDADKDQSYALFGMKRERLERTLLPVGGFSKPQIRELAKGLGLGVAAKKDSQEICFVTSGHHSDFVRARRPEFAATSAGEIVTTDGRVVGTHLGIDAFTIGQRKKLGVAMGEPYFVVRIEPESRRVVIGLKEELARVSLIANDTNWLVDPQKLPARVQVQIRYNGSPKPATVTVSAGQGDSFTVTFDEPELAVAPGQAAVVYDESRVLGGGWIQSSTSSV